ncbi:MAG: formate acetyltransferase, partial [Clostridia bacterium]|nr:formate acetyltransferase [Clostridia bacterium]
MLSYADRIASMRKTKIEHTLAKKVQNGRMDLDDFGTVPLPEGYEVLPWYNSDNGSFYGLDGMSENFVRVLDAHPAYVDPMEMLCGRWRDMLVNYRGDVHYMPDWMKKNPRLRDFVSQGANTLWSKRWDEKRFPYDDLKPYQKMYNIATGIDGDAHFACDYRIGLALGFGGFLEKIEKYRAVNPGKDDFYDAEKKCVEAMIRFIDRHIEKIAELLLTEERPEIAESLREMKATCEAIRYDAPKTFREACQWVAFFNCFARIYTRDGAGFQLDTILWPFYKADADAGRIDDETAKFLIANLLLIDPHYYQISGVDADDNDITNKLSWLILDGADMIDIACNLTVRVHDNCDPAFLRKAVEYQFKHKNGWPRFCGDKALLDGYMKNAEDKDIKIDKATARERIAVGCNWMCVPGREFPMNDTVKINIAKVLEQAIITLREEGGEPSIERLYKLWEMHLTRAVEVVAAGVNLHLDHIADVTPELIMNLMFKNSIERGEDASRCAELYTIGCDGAGLAVVADSFGAIETRIVNEKVLDWDTLFAALDNDFADERVRLIMKSAPKYCQGGTVSDEWAKRLTESFTRILRAQEMPAGRCLVPGWFSWARSIEYGKAVSATPNGRRAGEPLSHGANPNAGFRRDGAVTAQSNGIASVQPGYGNTAPLQLEFDPKLAAEDGGIDAVCTLIREHFAQGGTLININILDSEKILAAHENPELYPDLVVRVTGFTAYFVSLTPEFRRLVVDR